MPSSFRDPKTLADWIQLDYFRRPGRLWKVRNLVTGVLFLACLAMMGFTWWPRTHFIYESRPVSNAHTMFNDQCRACHTEAFQPARRLLRGDPGLRSVRDDTCRSCHDGPPHHGDDPHCASCHQEHRGQPVLAHVNDSHCTACHADLDRVGGSRHRYTAHISSFLTDHPDFTERRGEPLVDPGTIRFNHKVHLNLPAQALRGIDKPLAALRAQQCHYCHQPDATERYMKPINYEQHCSDCHGLAVRVAGAENTPALGAAAERFAQEPAPHREPLKVRAMLRERYTRFVQENPAVLGAQESAEPPRWIPSGLRAADVTEKQWQWVGEQLQTAERMVFDGANGCKYCHQEKPERGLGNLPEYERSQIRPRWFTHSVFNHERHRMLNCTECHKDAPKSSATKDVLLPRIDNCRQCHNPKVGTRTDCAECHLYHDRSRETFRGQRTIAEAIRKP